MRGRAACRVSSVECRGGARGFTYVGLLITIAIMGIGLAVTAEAWRTTAQRDRERELLFVGDQIRKAIVQYYESSPGGVKQFPRNLEDLLKDSRYPTTRRYLRKVYRDPMTGKREWGLVLGPGETIMGVYSLSRQTPMKRANFPPEYGSFAQAESYAAWRFAYSEAAPQQGGPANPEATAPAPGVPQPQSAPIPSSSILGKLPTQESPGATQPR